MILTDFLLIHSQILSEKCILEFVDFEYSEVIGRLEPEMALN